jgi:hypothetical protein
MRSNPFTPTLAVLLLAIPFARTASAQATQAAPKAPESDCLSENANLKNKMQFFVCLNAKREYCQDQLLKLQTECPQGSVKYSGTYNKYLAVKNKANQLLDMVVAELKYHDKTPPDKFKQLMREVSDSTQEFDRYVLGTTCDGASNRFLPLLIPIITAALLDRSRTLIDGWLSGNQNMKDQRAAEISSQRWRSPTEFGAQAPVVVAPVAPPPMDPNAPPSGS